MTRDFPAGYYRFIPAGFQYSSGAAADSGFEIECVRFDRLLPLAERLRRPQNLQNISRMRDGH
jgi:hypothetical protein